jgi:hypothetical protein
MEQPGSSVKDPYLARKTECYGKKPESLYLVHAPNNPRLE